MNPDKAATHMYVFILLKKIKSEVSLCMRAEYLGQSFYRGKFYVFNHVSTFNESNFMV